MSGYWRGTTEALFVTLGFLVAGGACSGNPISPTGGNTVDELVAALQDRGLNVMRGRERSPSEVRFFSVPGHDLIYNDAHIGAFEYRTAQAASSDAALVSLTDNQTQTSG